ncbi:hypothetical protein Tco_0863329 [Tanacetum coccineum]
MRKDTKVPQPSDPTNVADEAVNKEPSMKLKELMDFYTKLQQRVLDMENIKTVQAQEITSLKLRVKKLEKKGGSRTYKIRRLYKVGRSARIVSSDEASLGDQEDVSKQGRKIDNINKEAEITLVDETQGRHDDDIIFDVSDLAVSTASTIPVSAATITEDEITLAQALAELKSVKPKVTTATTTTTKGILLQDPSESITTTKIPSKDKGKAKFDDEVRLAREKDKANIALIEEWNDIQAKIDADYQLAQRLQAQEQEELTIEERAKLFQQLLEKRRKYFTAKRAEENRNIPPTKPQQRSIMPMDTKLVEGSEVRAEGREISYYQIIRADGSSKRYSTFIQMFRSFDREDLETLWKLVKAKHGYIRPEEGYERVLWGDLKIMFEHHVEDTVEEISTYICYKLIIGVKCVISFLSSSQSNSRINEVFGSILLVINEAFNEET